MNSVKLLNKIIKKELMCKQLDAGQKLMNLFNLSNRLYLKIVLDITEKKPYITVGNLDKFLPAEVIKLRMYSTLLAIELGYSNFENFMDDKEIVKIEKTFCI